MKGKKNTLYDKIFFKSSRNVFVINFQKVKLERIQPWQSAAIKREEISQKSMMSKMESQQYHKNKYFLLSDHDSY